MSGNDQGRDREERHEPHVPYEWHEPMDEQEHTQPHAGNGTVNHGPDELGPHGLDSDELALRDLLHQAVQDVEPRNGTLDHLRRAVPARRARKRQAAVGLVAAALFVGTAVPALLHVSGASGSNADPSIAGNSSQAHGGAGQGKNPDGGSGTSGGKGSKATGQGKDGGQSGDKGKGSGSGGGTGGAADPTASAGTSVPLCTAAQLGSATSSVDSPDSAGIVYGTFHVVNVSTASCTVGGQGTVSTLAQGAADAAKITVVQHASGDAAAALPDPSTEAAQLVLLPGAAYEVRFAWVPSQTCPTSGGTGGDTGGTPGPSADPSPTAGTVSGADTGGSSGVTTQLVVEDGTLDGSVVVSHTAETGVPTVSATVSNACAGTVYRTGVLSAS